MSEHKIPREELFTINDPALGKTFTIRECSDEQLAGYAANAMQQQQAMLQQLGAMMTQAIQTAAMASVMNYEMDRRRRTITLATPGDVINLRRQ